MSDAAVPMLTLTTQLTTQLGDELRRRAWMLCTAESCTGGLIAAACTDIAGSSDWFERGFVTYSNAAKTELLGVAPELIAAHGAVSEQVVRAMAQGAAKKSGAQVALATTGIAGPSGGTQQKPVGTVWMGWYIEGQKVSAQRMLFDGTRAQVRAQAVAYVLDRALRLLR